MKIATILFARKWVYLIPFIIFSQIDAFSQSCNCPSISSCGPCAGGFTSFTFQYNGPFVVLVRAVDGGGTIHADLFVSPGTIITVEGSMANGNFQGNILIVSITGIPNFSLNTSCGVPVSIGDTFGLFTLLNAESKDGGPLCCDVPDLEIVDPVISNCPSNIVVTLGASCSIPVTWAPPTATDNCGSVALTSTHSPGSLFSKGITPVIYTATDDYGNESTCTFNVTVNDETDPVISGCPANINVDANGSCQAVVNWVPPTVSDNCAMLSFTSDHNPGETFELGTTPVIYTATDQSGNTSTCTFNVTVSDNTDPIFTGCPTDITISANGSCEAVVTWTAPVASDNCTGVVASSPKNPGDIFLKGTTLVTYTATDGAGNTATCSFNVIVVDDNDPVITGCPSDITVSADGSCGAIVTWAAPTATDNCTGVTINSPINPGDNFLVGTTLVTYTATDAAGNTATCSFNVTVVDDTDPVITGCSSDITVSADGSCGAIVTWPAPTATDNCTGVTINSPINSGDNFLLGTTLVTYTATDGAGNTATCSFNVIVVDDTDPVITGCSSDITVSADGSCGAVVTWPAPTATDNCTGVAINSPINPGENFLLGTTLVTYTATDAAGNTATCSFNVIVVDDTDPVITGCSSDITVSADGSCGAIVTWSAPTATDNCTGVTINSPINPGDSFLVGTTLVTYTATDGAGNTATCSFNVIVVDDTDPVILSCPTDITVSADGSCGAIVTWSAPTATDNCTGVTINSPINPGDNFLLGTTLVTYTATDAAGNTATCSFNVTVVDDTNPVITGCSSDITVSANVSCEAIVTWSPPTATDNCTAVSISSPINPGDNFLLGTTLVTYTATDAAGNTATCSFNVIVVDDADPIISGCPSDITVSANGSCQEVVSWTPPTVSDNCAMLSFTSDHNPGEIFDLGTTLVTYTATDQSGNTSTCTFNVIVSDDTDPIFTGCPSDITLSANASCEAVATWTVPVASDNCIGVTTISTNDPGDVFSKGTTLVTYTATDAAGNTATCSFNVIVVDDTDPVITGCPSDITVSADGSCGAIVTWAAPTATDNCTGVAMNSPISPGDNFLFGTTLVTYTATDAAGNTATCSFKVTVVDDTDPVINGCSPDITVSANGSCGATVSWIPPSVLDNCPGASISSPINPGDNFLLGTTLVTYTATDGAGNTATCSFNVIVVDGTAPVISGCLDVYALANNSCEAPVSWTQPVTSDCSTVNLVGTHNSGDIFAIGTTVVTYTATDARGNISTCSFNVVVEDKVAPVFQNCPAEVKVNANQGCDALVSWDEPSVTDNCAIVTVTKSHSPGTAFPAGTTTVTYKAIDQYGNESVCKFNVVVKVAALPSINSCPEEIIVKSNEHGEFTVEWAPPTASATCGDVTINSSHTPGDIFAIGTTTVEYKAEDEYGNISYCRFNVVVTPQAIDIDISKIITPDGNAQNDEWIITNIEKYNINKVVVVDRWGSVIYSASGYNNTNVVWKGTNMQGNMVPTGTYFYTISVRYGPAALEKTGFIELIR